jgi:hypothetical protein
MSYPEFLARHNVGPSPIPEGLLKDDKGAPAQRTDAQWAQLDELYAINPTEKQGPAPPGHVGGPIWNANALQMGVTLKEATQMLLACNIPSDGFTFKIGYPQYDTPAPGAATMTVHIGVLMQVKPWLQKSFGANLYRLLKPYDNYQPDRSPFTFVTYQGGPYHPETFYLSTISAALWDSACAEPGVVLVLKDGRGEIINVGTTNAGFTGNLPTLLASPPEVRRMPAYAYLMPNADRTFDGNGRMNLDFSRGWYYDFTFTLPMDDVRRLDRAEAFLVSPHAASLAAAVATAKTVSDMQPAFVMAATTDLQGSIENALGKGSRWSAQAEQALTSAAAGAVAAQPGMAGGVTGGGAVGALGGGPPPVTARGGLPGGLPMPPGPTVSVP